MISSQVPKAVDGKYDIKVECAVGQPGSPYIVAQDSAAVKAVPQADKKSANKLDSSVDKWYYLAGGNANL